MSQLPMLVFLTPTCPANSLQSLHSHEWEVHAQHLGPRAISGLHF